MNAPRLLAAMAIGILLGCVVWYLSDRGYFYRWERLSISSEDIPRLFSVTYQEHTGGMVHITKPCKYSQPQFSWLASPPQGIADCLQREELDPGGSTIITYVLDANGTVWRRTQFNNARAEFLNCIFLPSAGLLLGLIVALVLELIGKIRRRYSTMLTEGRES